MHPSRERHDMKAERTKKTLKVAAAATGLAAVLTLPGCATAASTGGTGLGTGGTTCVPIIGVVCV